MKETKPIQFYVSPTGVNGRRAPRPRLPRQGCFRIEEPLGAVVWEGDLDQQLFTGQDRFRFAPGDLRAWRNLRDIEFVALHFWIESRIPFRAINPRTRKARLQWKSRMRLTDDHTRQGAPHYVENFPDCACHSYKNDYIHRCHRRNVQPSGANHPCITHPTGRSRCCC